MAYPTGSGSEILGRTTIDAQLNTPTAFRWDGTPATPGTSTGTGYLVPANHIVTVLNISVCEQADSTTQGFYIWINNGTSDVYIVHKQLLPAASTFVYNDKIVLIGGDTLEVVGYQTTALDFVCNYIIQDWS